MRPKFAKCILHIGTEKTGSTTLQRFLALNREELLRQGYFVPRSLSPYKKFANHERLTTYALNVRKVTDDLRLVAGLRETSDVDVHRCGIRADFSAEIDKLEIRPEILLLSNEHCHSRLVEEDEVLLLKELLGQYVEKFEILVYLRAQHDLAISLYSQALRAGYFDIGILPEFDGKAKSWVNRQYFDYADLLHRWSSVFGLENITVRLYSKDDLVRANVIDDFMNAIRGNTEGLVIPADVNSGISRDNQSVLNAYNRFCHGRKVSKPIERSQLIAMLESLPGGLGRYPSRSKVERFFSAFEESNEEVRRIFFPNRERLFVADFSRFPEEDEPMTSETDALMMIIIRFLGAKVASEQGH